MPPCQPWATAADLCPPYDELLDDYQEWFFDIASEILFDLTEQAYPGICDYLVRPPARCGCVSSCRCGSVSEIRLNPWPVVEIIEVLVDGEVVPPDRYRVDNGSMLVLMPQPGDRMRAWPSRQQLNEPTTEDGTWSVAYTAGVAPPQGGVHAAAVLAGELIMSCNPDLRDRCQLPRNTISASSKGRTVAMIDPAQLAERGETGIPLVDQWIRADRWKRTHTGGAVYTGLPGNRSVYT